MKWKEISSTFSSLASTEKRFIYIQKFASFVEPGCVLTFDELSPWCHEHCECPLRSVMRIFFFSCKTSKEKEKRECEKAFSKSSLIFCLSIFSSTFRSKGGISSRVGMTLNLSLKFWISEVFSKLKIKCNSVQIMQSTLACREADCWSFRPSIRFTIQSSTRCDIERGHLKGNREKSVCVLLGHVS